MNIKDRFLKYVSFETASSEAGESSPSTDGQKVFAEYLKNELEEIGLKDVCLDENGYLYAFLPANNGSESSIGFIAHMDTSPSVSGKEIKPESVLYTGGAIKLKKCGEISAAVYPFLQDFVGQELIVTDGTTLLGADDKAGIAEIVTACDYLLTHPEIKHKGISAGERTDLILKNFTQNAPIPWTADSWVKSNMKILTPLLPSLPLTE